MSSWGLALPRLTNFIGLRILALGGTEAQIGLGFALNAVFLKIPIMFMGARLMRRFSIVQLIVAGLLGFATVYFTCWHLSLPTVILFAMPALGLFYAGFWMSVVAYANETAPPTCVCYRTIARRRSAGRAGLGNRRNPERAVVG